MTNHWIIYPLKNFRKNELAQFFNENILQLYDDMSKEYPQMLGIIADNNGSLVMLNYYIQASRFIQESHNNVIKEVRGLLDGKANHLAMKFDETDMNLNNKLTKDNPLQIEAGCLDLPESKEKIWRLIWEMRVSNELELEKSTFVSHGGKVNVDMFETGDQVMIWLAEGQQLYGVAAKFGLVDDNAVIKVVVTKNSVIRYNGGTIDVDVGDTISAPLKSVEKYNPQKTD